MEVANSPPPPMMTDAFAAIYEASAHRITGPISVAALDLAGLVGPGQRVIDIAAGAGALSGPAAERGAEVVAIDLSPGMVNRLGQPLRPFPHCSAQVMDGQALEVWDAEFDAAFSIFGASLFAHWRKGLEEQARVVRPGGKGCVATWRDPPGGGPFIVMAEAIRAALPELALPPPPEGVVALAGRERLVRETRDAGFGEVEAHEVEGRWIGRAGEAYLSDNGALHGYMPGYASLSADDRRRVDEEILRLVEDRAHDGRVELAATAIVAVGVRG